MSTHWSSKRAYRLAAWACFASAIAAPLALVGCDDDDKPAVVDGAGTTPPTPDAAVGDADVDGGAPDGAPVTAAIPITAWVHDLVTNFGPMSAPDTVDDKNIKDTDDPAAFDPILPMMP